MTPRARRTDPIYNVCLRCGQVGHCSASCARGRGNAKVSRAAGVGLNELLCRTTGERHGTRLLQPD